MNELTPEARVKPATTTGERSVVDAFLVAASARRDSGHASGTLEAADGLLREQPELAEGSIHAAALGLADAEWRMIALRAE